MPRRRLAATVCLFFFPAAVGMSAAGAALTIVGTSSDDCSERLWVTDVVSIVTVYACPIFLFLKHIGIKITRRVQRFLAVLILSRFVLT